MLSGKSFFIWAGCDPRCLMVKRLITQFIPGLHYPLARRWIRGGSLLPSLVWRYTSMTVWRQGTACSSLHCPSFLNGSSIPLIPTAATACYWRFTVSIPPDCPFTISPLNKWRFGGLRASSWPSGSSPLTRRHCRFSHHSSMFSFPNGLRIVGFS